MEKQSSTFFLLILFFVPLTFAQENIEAIAKLHFKIQSRPMQWFEGYNLIQSGSYSPYQSHRSGVKQRFSLCCTNFWQ
jgi:hypothetical protein